MTDQKVQELLSRMTLEEKIGQLVQLDGGCYGVGALATGPQAKLGITQDVVDVSGSVLNVLGADKVRAIQARYLSRSRLKIPLLFMADVIYGYKNVYPIPLGLGCTWNPALIREDYRMIAEEACADGCMVTFSPPVDLVRDARWGRCMESPGEDAWLNSRYAKAMVEGFQNDLDPAHSVASCVKHYAAYGAVEAGREYNTVDMSERRLRQDYLPGYKAAVDAGCMLVMTSFNTIDSVPVTANRWLVKGILRDEWGFGGVVITDYAAIQELKAHGVAASDREASRLAMDATVDIDMKTPCYANQLAGLVRDGALREEQIDEACLRVLRLKNRLGLFEDPYRRADAACAEATAHDPAHAAAARKTAQRAAVLLKNEGNVLPLRKQGQRIALIGPYADSADIIGMWAIHADRGRAVTLRSAMEEKLAGGVLGFSQGCRTVEALSALGEFGNVPALQGEDAGEAAAARWEQEALALAAESDVVVAAMGEHMLQSGESGSRTDITLPAPQKRLLKKLRAVGKPVVLVLFNGRPLALEDIEADCDAILEAWFPGTQGGPALADLLFGDAAPSGRLTVSFPYTVGQEPLYYNGFNTGRPAEGSGHSGRFVSRYLDCPNEAKYPFGYGLGYHTAVYSGLTLSADTLRPGGTLSARVTVRNTGAAAGVEVVQLYLRDLVGSVARPVRELKDFRRITLQPGESRTVEFVIREAMLAFLDRNMEWTAEPGTFEVMIGPHCMETQKARFEFIV